MAKLRRLPATRLVYSVDADGVAPVPDRPRADAAGIVEEVWARTRWRNPGWCGVRLSDADTVVWVEMLVDCDWQTALLFDVRWGPGAARCDHLAAWVVSGHLAAHCWHGRPHGVGDTGDGPAELWAWFVAWAAARRHAS